VIRVRSHLLPEGEKDASNEARDEEGADGLSHRNDGGSCSEGNRMAL
jgi:hypothetical protein